MWSGRVDASGELKKQLPMVARGPSSTRPLALRAGPCGRCAGRICASGVSRRVSRSIPLPEVLGHRPAHYPDTAARRRGRRLSPIDYMVWKDHVNVLDQWRIFRLLAKGPRLEGYLTQSKTAQARLRVVRRVAQNRAGRRIPFENPAYSTYWNRASGERPTSDIRLGRVRRIPPGHCN